jgi:hypothetical protein
MITTNKGKAVEVKILQVLVARWKRSAAYAFKSAKLETDVIGKKLIEHGAMCYFNCYRELQTLFGELPASTIPPNKEKVQDAPGLII